MEFFTQAVQKLDGHHRSISFKRTAGAYRCLFHARFHHFLYDVLGTFHRSQIKTLLNYQKTFGHFRQPDLKNFGSFRSQPQTCACNCEDEQKSFEMIKFFFKFGHLTVSSGRKINLNNIDTSYVTKNSVFNHGASTVNTKHNEN